MVELEDKLNFIINLPIPVVVCLQWLWLQVDGGSERDEGDRGSCRERERERRERERERERLADLLNELSSFIQFLLPVRSSNASSVVQLAPLLYDEHKAR